MPLRYSLDDRSTEDRGDYRPDRQRGSDDAGLGGAARRLEDELRTGKDGDAVPDLRDGVPAEQGVQRDTVVRL